LSAKIKAADVRKKYETFDKDKILEEVIDLVLENDKLKRKLKKYENPHTPSSKQGFDKPQALGIRVGRKKGKKYNYLRTTRPKDKPTIFVNVTTDVNPSNKNKNIAETGYYFERIITDIKIEKIVTSYKINEYKDLNTGELFFASHPNLPEKGVFGKNIIALANILHFEYRVTLQGVADLFTHTANISMAAPTVIELCNRATNKVEPVYQNIKINLMKSNVVNADETGSNQNGKSEWLWGFFTPIFAFFTFCPKRGGDIVEKVLGKDFKGFLGCDGWVTYKIFSEENDILLQRCWAHLIREVKSTCKDVKDLNDAYIWVCDMFEKIKKLREIKSKKRRQIGYDKLVAEMNMWCQIYYSYDGMKELVNKVKNGKESWFTCVLYPEIEPTNNRAERGLRKFVIIEKIIGCLRSEQGKQNMQVMLSVLQTWRLQGLNPCKELRAVL